MVRNLDHRSHVQNKTHVRFRFKNLSNRVDIGACYFLNPVGLYFTAQWCLPVVKFTLKLDLHLPQNKGNIAG
ncbi:hypothetical protein RHGRI_015835 [Rhododendron griersonianum]|uniref:Uncharacterized protein n=1 Tax=Rhododendron griersonianum TaxID=479676 RepID=A0AAV6JQ98_9ERIC|nr:hypothetical protein RHGRI_015835 [Rhododendron griersonianum]